MPGITKILELKSRNPEKSALLLFIKRFKSFDEIQRIGKTRFLSAYTTLMKKTPDRYAPKKGLAIYEPARESITTRGEDPYIWAAQDQCVDLLSTAQNAADEIITQMQNIAETIPEYSVQFGLPCNSKIQHNAPDNAAPFPESQTGPYVRRKKPLPHRVK